MVPGISAPNKSIRIEELTPAAFSPFGSIIQNPSTHNGVPQLETTTANQGTATKWQNITEMYNWYHEGRSKKPAQISMNMFVCVPREPEKTTGSGGDSREVFRVKIMERHPFTAQTFVPIGLGKEDRDTCYLVVVAPTLPLKGRHSLQSDLIEPPYPLPAPRRKRTFTERLLGARPNPFTNDHRSNTTSPSPLANATPPKGPGLPDIENIRAFIVRGDQGITYGPGTWHAPMVVLGKQAIEFVVVQYANGVGNEDVQEILLESEKEDEGVAVEVERFFDGDLPAVLRAKL